MFKANKPKTQTSELFLQVHLHFLVIQAYRFPLLFWFQPKKAFACAAQACPSVLQPRLGYACSCWVWDEASWDLIRFGHWLYLKKQNKTERVGYFMRYKKVTVAAETTYVSSRSYSGGLGCLWLLWLTCNSWMLPCQVIFSKVCPLIEFQMLSLLISNT